MAPCCDPYTGGVCGPDDLCPRTVTSCVKGPVTDGFWTCTGKTPPDSIINSPPGVSPTQPPPVVPSTTLAPPDVIGGSWEYLGFSASGEVVDIVLLTLVDFPPGQLTGSWSETAAPGYTSLALNGTECAGCNGVAGAYANDFNVTGVVHGSTFSIDVQDNYNASFSGALGKAVPYGATSYGCVPLNSSEEMFLVSGSSAYDFFQPGSGLAIGSHVSC